MRGVAFELILEGLGVHLGALGRSSGLILGAFGLIFGGSGRIFYIFLKKCDFHPDSCFQMFFMFLRSEG